MGLSTGQIDPEELKRFPAFKAFTRAELKILSQSMRRLEVPQGTVLFPEGSPGDTCFVVVRGVVAVTVEVRHQQQLLAKLTPGSIFGEVSMIDGEPRSATCSIQRDAVLAELDREACARLLHGRSGLAVKLLGLLNQSIISALRNADRQLMQLNAGAGIPRSSLSGIRRIRPYA